MKRLEEPHADRELQFAHTIGISGPDQRNAVLVHKIGVCCAEYSPGFGYVQENTRSVTGAALGLVSTQKCR